MQLASMVHDSGRVREVHDHRQLQHSHFYSQPPTRPYEVASSLAQTRYSSQPPVDYQYQRAPPQSPPSPPSEEINKPSLPSISSLLGIADGERTTTETAGQSPTSSQHQPSPRQQQIQPQSNTLATQVEGRPDQASNVFGPAIVSNPRMTLPPTPPMHPESVVDGNQSPSATSTHSAISTHPYYLGSSLNNVEPHQQRQHIAAAPVKRSSVVSQASMSPYNTSPYASSPYAPSPGASSTASFYSPESHVYTSAGMYAQRSLPSNFPPPPPMPMALNGGDPNAANVWQHHHYISASSQAAFPQSQDRYICQTCNKAFSRPSSLRIHSHSHTGEKPYKCPQPGCGKAFSVRSNMKRHERGCHAGSNAAISA